MQRKFDVEELLATARQRTGLSDFGPADFMEGLTLLVDDLNTEADIRADRWDHAQDRLLRLLMNRLWFAKDLTNHPEILNEEIGSPVIIASLPRTGSTKLHRMLGASQGFQTLRWWQAHMFARIPGLADGGIARRIEETRAFEKWMYQVSPEMYTGHPMFTDEPEEDQWLMECTFRHNIPFASFSASNYVQWAMTADMQPNFDYFNAQIKYLQWQEKQFHNNGDTAPWLLKTPNHMGDELRLTQSLNKPRFIFTHRDPAKTIPSTVHTGMAMRKPYSDKESRAMFVQSLMIMYPHVTAGHLRWRDSQTDAEILDLGFREITEDGAGTARKVYDFLGRPFTAAAERGVREWERNNPKDKHGKLVHSAADIGLTDDAIHAAFAPYIERYSNYF